MTGSCPKRRGLGGNARPMIGTHHSMMTLRPLLGSKGKTGASARWQQLAGNSFVSRRAELPELKTLLSAAGTQHRALLPLLRGRLCFKLSVGAFGFNSAWPLEVFPPRPNPLPALTGQSEFQAGLQESASPARKTCSA